MPIKLFLGWKHKAQLSACQITLILYQILSSIYFSIPLPRMTEVLNQNWESSRRLLKTVSSVPSQFIHVVWACIFLNSILKLQKKHNKNILEAVQFLYCFSVSVIWGSHHSSLNYSDQANYKSSSSQNNSTYTTLTLINQLYDACYNF